MEDRVVYIIGDDGRPILVSLGGVLYHDMVSGTHTEYRNSLNEWGS